MWKNIYVGSRLKAKTQIENDTWRADKQKFGYFEENNEKERENICFTQEKYNITCKVIEIEYVLDETDHDIELLAKRRIALLLDDMLRNLDEINVVLQSNQITFLQTRYDE